MSVLALAIAALALPSAAQARDLQVRRVQAHRVVHRGPRYAEPSPYVFAPATANDDWKRHWGF